MYLLACCCCCCCCCRSCLQVLSGSWLGWFDGLAVGCGLGGRAWWCVAIQDRGVGHGLFLFGECGRWWRGDLARGGKEGKGLASVAAGAGSTHRRQWCPCGRSSILPAGLRDWSTIHPLLESLVPSFCSYPASPCAPFLAMRASSFVGRERTR